MLKSSLKALIALPIAALSLGVITSNVKAADLQAVATTPTGNIKLDNKFDFTGTLSIKARTDGTVYIDFQPPQDAAPPSLLPAITACAAEVTTPASAPILACTAALENPANQPSTFGQYNYAQENAGVGAFDQFETPLADFSSSNGLSKDVLLPAIVPVGGRDLSIPNFLALDSTAVTKPLPTGGTFGANNNNFFDVTRLFPVVLEEVPNGSGGVLRTNLSFTVDGIYRGPLTGPLLGSLSYALTFDGQTAAQVTAQLFDPASAGVVNKGFQATGTLKAAVPEPNAVAGLALLAVSSVLFLGKGKKKDIF